MLLSLLVHVLHVSLVAPVVLVLHLFRVIHFVLAVIVVTTLSYTFLTYEPPPNLFTYNNDTNIVVTTLHIPHAFLVVHA